MEKWIKTTAENGVAVLSINRPEVLNALSRQVIDEIDAFVTGLDTSTRVLLIYSERNFAAGADIKEMMGCGREEARRFLFSPTYQKISALEIPTIAAIDGYALGGGLELALCCDIRIASDRAKLGFPEINLGIMPGAGGTVRAPRTLGYSLGLEMILTGEPVRVERALQIGLVNRVVPQEVLFPETMRLAAVLAGKAPVAVRTAKAMIRRGAEMPEAEAIAIEAEKWSDLFETADQKEGMRAFTENRKPVFQGK